MSLFFDIYKKENPDQNNLVDQLIKLKKSGVDYTSLQDLLDNEEQFKIFCDIAGKAEFLERSARKIASGEIQRKLQNSANDGAGFSADNPHYVFSEFRQHKVREEDVQKLFNDFQIINKLTAHPDGNEYSTEFLIAALELETILDRGEDKAVLIEKLKQISAIPLVSVHKKTQEQEYQETYKLLENYYYSVVDIKNNIESSAEKYGYKIKISKPFLELGVWLSGDGDGNYESTAEKLELQYNALEFGYLNCTGIRKLYSDELEQFSESESSIKNIQKKLTDKDHSGFYNNVEEFQTELNSLKTFLDKALFQALENLIYKTTCFGFYFAKTDIRHDFDSFLGTVARVFDKTGLVKESEFNKKNYNEKYEFIKNVFNDEDIISKAKKLKSVELVYADDDISFWAKNIFERFRVNAKNPLKTNCYIISENKDKIGLLANLFLQKVTGNEVCNDKAQNDVTMLIESKYDLENLRYQLQNISNDELLLSQFKARGKFRIMIALSDNLRKDGFSTIDDVDEAIKDLTKWYNSIKYTLFKGIECEIFLGGGGSNVRGNDNSYNQFPDRLRYLYNRVDSGQFLQPITTTQGYQNHMLFSPKSNAEFIIQANLMQMVSGAASVLKLIPRPKYRAIKDEPASIYDQKEAIARNAGEIWKAAAQQDYKLKMSDVNITGFLNEYAPKVFAVVANSASRSSARGQKDSFIDRPYQEILKTIKPIDQNRAVQADTMMNLCKVLSLPYLGECKGLEEAIKFLDGKYVEGVKVDKSILFHYSRPHRKKLITIATSLGLVNDDMMWHIISDEKVPSIQEKLKLAQRYNEINSVKDKSEKDKIILAYLQSLPMGRDLAEKVYICSVVDGERKIEELKAQNIFEKKFELSSPLKEINLMSKILIENNKKRSGFNDYLLAKFFRIFLKDRSKILTDNIVRTIKSISLAVNITAKPPTTSLLGIISKLFEEKNIDNIKTAKNEEAAFKIPKSLQ